MAFRPVGSMCVLVLCVLVIMTLSGCERSISNRNFVGTWESTDEAHVWTFTADGKAHDYSTVHRKTTSFAYRLTSPNRIEIERSWPIRGIFKFEGQNKVTILFGVQGSRPKSMRDTGLDVQDPIILIRK